ncbi:MAG: holo-ACP synthase [Alphaproteobacteria bacterium]|nr:holo-ACP synthase [Alphaproteobacteria bacterium]
MILGIGCDICNIERIEKVYGKYGKHFVDKYFSEREKKELVCKTKRDAEVLSKKFAAKEALSKAFGTGIAKGVSWCEIEVLHKENGQPYIELKGKTADIANTIGAEKFWVSLSDDYPWAQAFVVIED